MIQMHEEDIDKQWYVICEDVSGLEYFIYDTMLNVLEMEDSVGQAIGHGWVRRDHLVDHEEEMLKSCSL